MNRQMRNPLESPKDKDTSEDFGKTNYSIDMISREKSSQLNAIIKDFSFKEGRIANSPGTEMVTFADLNSRIHALETKKCSVMRWQESSAKNTPEIFKSEQINRVKNKNDLKELRKISVNRNPSKTFKHLKNNSIMIYNNIIDGGILKTTCSNDHQFERNNDYKESKEENEVQPKRQKIYSKLLYKKKGTDGRYLKNGSVKGRPRTLISNKDRIKMGLKTRNNNFYIKDLKKKELTNSQKRSIIRKINTQRHPPIINNKEIKLSKVNINKQSEVSLASRRDKSTTEKKKELRKKIEKKTDTKTKKLILKFKRELLNKERNRIARRVSSKGI